MARCRCGAAEAEHRGPDGRPQPGEPPHRGGVRAAPPRAGVQRVRSLQGRTLSQRHTRRCVPHTGQYERGEWLKIICS